MSRAERFHALRDGGAGAGAAGGSATIETGTEKVFTAHGEGLRPGGRGGGPPGWGSRVLIILLALIMLTASGGGYFASRVSAGEQAIERVRQRIQKFERDLRQAEQERQRQAAELGRVRSEEKDLNYEVFTLEQQIEESGRRLDELTDQLEEAEADLARAEAELALAEKQLAEKDALLRNRIRTVYERGAVSYLEVLFSATSFQDFLQRFSALRLMVGKDTVLFESARDHRRTVDEKREEADAHRLHVADLVEEQRRAREELQVRVASREQQLARIQGSKAELERALDEWEETSREITRQLRAAQDELRELLAAYGLVPDKFAVNPLANMRITSHFGRRYHPILRYYRQHTGTDLGAPSGTTIRAAWPGMVTYSGLLGSYGNVVMISHGADSKGRQVVTLYAHASSLLVKVGQRVEAGESIARVGRTGLATGPHLHLEVRLDGTPVNPLPYFP